MKFLNLNRVLCISAHPDDTEYGALGSMIKFKDTQFDVVVLSNGGDFDKSSGFNREKSIFFRSGKTIFRFLKPGDFF